MFTRKTVLLAITSGVCASALLVSSYACRHDSSNDGAPFYGKRFKQSFHAGVSVGDLAEVKIDTNELRYSYEVTEGIYNGTKKSGSLQSLPEFGGALYKTDAGANLLVVPNEVIIGGIMNHFYVGVPTQSAALSAADLTGTYNYIHFMETSQGDHTGYGSVELSANGTFHLAEKKAVSQAKLQDITSGTYKDLGNGVVELFATDSNKVANVLVRARANGQTFAVIDFSQGTGYAGIGFAQKQSAVQTKVSLEGEYNILVTGEEKSTTGDVVGNDYIRIKEPDSQNLFSIKLSQNSPWNGLVSGESVGKLPDIDGEKDMKLRFYGIYSESSKTLYGVIEYLNNRNQPSKVVPASAFIAIKK